ncbi:MAG: hypothetical protein KIH67_004085 [Candidatus Moranbacteria bacterium]|nr:hypothetical protein [Candidatus Moranbacteria bacterium]
MRLLPHLSSKDFTRNLFLLNFGLFLLFAISAVAPSSDEPLLKISFSLLVLSICLPLAGINLASITEKLFQKKFNWLEKLFLATTLSFIIPPLFITLLFSFLLITHPLTPVFFSFITFIFAWLLNPQFLEFPEESLWHSLKKNQVHLLFTTLFFATFTTIIVRAFYALPDLDPYYWLSLYQKDFTNGIVTALHLYRPLFSSLAYIFIKSAQIDSYAYFKYVLPFFSLLLVLPLTLIASFFTSKKEKVIVYLFPFVTGSFVLYSHTPIPQAILNFGLILFCLSLLISYFSKNRFFFFWGGFILAGTAFYHEAAGIILLLWIFSTLLFYKNSLKSLYQKNPFLIALLSVFIILHLLSLFSSVFQFIFLWIQNLFVLFQKSTFNFAYPATYINIDGMSVGWNSPMGVLRYYAFYAGPLFFILFGYFFYFFWKKYPFYRTLSTSPEIFVLSLSAFVFFSISELLPRFFNIALLPERAWGITVLFAFALFIPALNYLSRRWLWTPYLVICLLFINIIGALYINQLKQFLITPPQLYSADWIKTSLPSNAIVFTSGNENLLRTHAQIKTISTNDPLFYFDQRIFFKLLDDYSANSPELDFYYKNFQQQVTLALQNINSFTLTAKKDDLLREAARLEKISQDFQKEVPLSSQKNPEHSLHNIYVYYAKPDARNPYARRPYSQNSQITKEPAFIYDQVPEHFQRVYTYPNEEIIIWQYIP